MSILDRVRSVAADRLGSSIKSATSSVVPGLLGTNLGGAITAGITQGPKAALALIPNLKANATDLVLGEVSTLTSKQGLSNAKSQAAQLAAQFKGKQASKAVLAPLTPPPARPALPSATPWAPAPVFGGLSMERYRQHFVDSAMIPKARKNLFFLQFFERKASPDAPNGPAGFNLFALDVSFGTVTLTGDQVKIGSANYDHLEGTERTELRVTAMDDTRGSVKRWFMGKSAQAAHADGTFGLPADYLLTLSITHMATEAVGPQDPRFEQRFLVRTAQIEVDLSRRESAIEELQLTFVQYDTFMDA